MNDKLLLQKRINFNKDYIEFLYFIHPDFIIVDDLDGEFDNKSNGIIYNGQYENDTLDRLKSFTQNWIIVNMHHFDLDLSTNEGLIKYLLPIQYIKIKNSKSDSISVYNSVSYDCLLDKIKLSLISNTPISIDDENTQSSYLLFQAILCTPDKLNEVFFNLVNSKNISYITSSVLTFLNKVQSQNIKRDTNVYYARLITQSNERYGKRIKQAISHFIKSKANKEIALYHLVTELNGLK
jgi:hypothetical protein